MHQSLNVLLFVLFLDDLLNCAYEITDGFLVCSCFRLLIQKFLLQLVMFFLTNFHLRLKVFSLHCLNLEHFFQIKQLLFQRFNLLLLRLETSFHFLSAVHQYLFCFLQIFNFELLAV